MKNNVQNSQKCYNINMAKIEIKLDTKTNRYKQVLDREDDPKEKASNIIRHLVSILNRELDRYLKEND